MAKRSVKIGPTGRLGARYGVKIRRRIRDIESGVRGWHTCPKCKARAVRRKATGIWVCRHCGAKIASAAYNLAPPRAVRREITLETLEGEEIEDVSEGQSDENIGEDLNV